MPLPPRDLTLQHHHAGVRVALFHRISPMAKFVGPDALVLLQRELERGNDLALMLSETAWAHLMCLPDIAAVCAIMQALAPGAHRNGLAANAAVCSVVGVGVVPVVCPPPPAVRSLPPPAVRSLPPPAHSSRGAGGAKPKPEPATWDTVPRRWDTSRREVATLVRISDGALTARDLAPMLRRMEALGPALAARAVRETGIRVLAESLQHSTNGIVKAFESVLAKYEF
jgi:hypothetical protein